MSTTRTFTGGCHCGNVEVTFETAKDPAQLAVNACTCSFCRRHGAHTMSDPEGRARITAEDPAGLNRYRFALRTADFLICRGCGVYVAAAFTDGETGRAYATLNVNAFDAPEAFARPAEAVDYGHETEAERRERRKGRWTPLQGPP